MSRELGLLERGRRDGNFVELMDDLDAPILANNPTTGRPTSDCTTRTDPRHRRTLRGVVGMTNVYVDRMAPAFSEGKYRFGKHPTHSSRSSHRPPADGADVVVAVTGRPPVDPVRWPLTVSVDVMFSAHTHEYTYDPIVVEETETVVVESGMGEAIGRVDLRVRDGRYSSVTTSTV